MSNEPQVKPIAQQFKDDLQAVIDKYCERLKNKLSSIRGVVGRSCVMMVAGERVVHIAERDYGTLLEEVQE